MQAVSVTTLRNNIKKYLDEVTNSSDMLIVSRSAKEEAVVIISLKEYNSLQETNYLLSAPNNKKRLLQAIKEIEIGHTHKFNL